jgi:SulP family sulfate permease
VLHSVNEQQQAKFMLIVGDGINQVDASGEEALHEIIDQMKGHDLTVVFSGLKKQIHDVMKETRLYDVVGEENLFATEDMALQEIYRRLGKRNSDAKLLVKSM